MADISLVFKVTQVELGVVTVDASISEDHNAEIETTDNPVEVGADVTDSARPKPRTFTMEGLVSDSPFVSGNAGAQPGRSLTAYKQLLQLHDTPQLITVVTGLETYQNLLMTSLNVPRTAQTGRAVRFRASFKEIQIVASQTVQIARKVPKTLPPANLGKQAATPTAPPASLLLSGGQKLGLGGVFAPGG